ncbi:DUF6457 domain-containing protein [Streptomyces sp. NPDC004082]
MSREPTDSAPPAAPGPAPAVSREATGSAPCAASGPAPAVSREPTDSAPSAAPGPAPVVGREPNGSASPVAPAVSAEVTGPVPPAAPGSAQPAHPREPHRGDTVPAPHPAAQAPRPPQGTPPDGVLLTDRDGREQPLVAVYRAEALRRVLEGLAGARGGLDGLPLRQVTAALELTRLPDPVASFDCDTWDDIATARSRIREHGLVLDEWISAVKDELGIDLDVDTGILLDLARDAAHSVARPSAPLTTFLVGYAAARAGGGPEAVAEAARKASALALAWEAEDLPAPPPAPAGEGPVVRPDAG